MHRQMLQEAGDVVRRDGGQVADLVAKAEVEEAIGEAPAVEDRALAQAALPPQVGLVIPSQLGPGTVLGCRRRHRFDRPWSAKNPTKRLAMKVAEVRRPSSSPMAATSSTAVTSSRSATSSRFSLIKRPRWARHRLYCEIEDRLYF